MKPFLRLLATILLTSPVLPQGAFAEKPNILFVICDQWRAQALGYAGDPNVQTPHLDNLRHSSIDFVNAVSTIPVCSPARASLMTGQRALTHGVFINDVQLSPEADSLGKELKTAGYDTGYIGKWHLNGDGRFSYIPPERRQGFDYWKVLECTHEYNASQYYAGNDPKIQLWKGYDAIAQTTDACQYLRDHANSGKPFCLFVSFGPPHDPYFLAPDEYKVKYQAGSIKLRANVPQAAAFRARTCATGYYANCTALDDCVGRLLGTLDEIHATENTIVVFTADHGDLLGSHNYYEKQQPYDESIRIPLLLHWPKGLGVAGKMLDAPFAPEDFMPTLLDLCNLPIPKTVQGLNFGAYVRGGANPSDDAAIISCVTPFGAWNRSRGGKEYRGIRTTRYTYVRDLKGPWLLFDDQVDPYQMKNLVNNPEFAKLQAELDAKLTQKLKQNGDEFQPGEIYLKKWSYPANEKGSSK